MSKYEVGNNTMRLGGVELSRPCVTPHKWEKTPLHYLLSSSLVLTLPYLLPSGVVYVICLENYFVSVMANNGTYSANNAANSTSDTITLDLTYAALSISIGAFILSSLQALLAYLQFGNSEVGRRRCSEEVMGELWAGKTIKRFKWREWRYQVFFEVPVFYTAPPG
jgi:hypothetical protein